MPTLLSQFGFLEIRGVDAEKFLQGYCTCDLGYLQAEQGIYGALTNIKGRVEATFIARRLNEALDAEEGPGLLLKLHRSLVTPIMAHLQKYIVFSKARLTDRSDEIHCYGFRKDESLPQTNLRLLKSGSSIELWTQATIQSDDREAEWLARDLIEGRIWISADVSGLYLPQELAMDESGGVDFEKGCYLGQEIIARVHFKGQTKQHLVLYQLVETLDVDLSTPIVNAQGVAVGRVIQGIQTERQLIIAALIDRSIQSEHLSLGPTALIPLS